MANGIRKSTVKRLIRRSQRDLTGQEVGQLWHSDPKRRALSLRLLDSKQYRAVDEAAWRAILQHNGISKFTYVSELADCDDFAFALRGMVPLEFRVNGIGLVRDWSGGHAYNCILVVQGDEVVVRFIEPQSDRFISAGSGMYKLTSAEAEF